MYQNSLWLLPLFLSCSKIGVSPEVLEIRLGGCTSCTDALNLAAWLGKVFQLLILWCRYVVRLGGEQIGVAQAIGRGQGWGTVGGESKEKQCHLWSWDRIARRDVVDGRISAVFSRQVCCPVTFLHGPLFVFSHVCGLLWKSSLRSVVSWDWPARLHWCEKVDIE